MESLAKAAESRLVSLDVFRGATMAAMVIVNNPGDWSTVYAPLLHAPWHGLTPTDLIFPFFLFIVGVAIPLGRRSAATAATIARRSSVIFGLGLLLALYPRFDLATVRIPGVLQRIAVCYLVVALFYRWRSAHDLHVIVRDALLATTVVLIAYWLMIRGDLTPDGNVGAAIDRAVFGEHLWRQSRTWDPEGLFSTLPTIGTTLLGLVAGLLLFRSPGERRVREVTVGAAILLALGLAWATVFPLNKNLWTSSYVLVTAGLAALALCATHLAFDGGRARRLARPFVILGRNALLLFVVSGFLVKTMLLVRIDGGGGETVALSRWIYLAWFAPLASPKNASLLYACANLAVLFLLLWWLDRRRWYLRA